MEVSVLNINGQETGRKVALNDAIFGIEPNEAIMVGDRKYDVLGAKKCGLDCVGVRFGYAEPNELEEYGAVYIAKTADDLYNYLTD